MRNALEVIPHVSSLAEYDQEIGKFPSMASSMLFDSHVQWLNKTHEWESI